MAPPDGQSSGDSTARALPDVATVERAVADYLRQHPDFLARHPDLLSSMQPPQRTLGDGVVDLQQAMVSRQRHEIDLLRQAQRHLIATSRGNAASQSRVHQAVLALIGATSFEHLIQIITEEMTLLLDVDAVGLAIERGRRPARTEVAGVQVLEPGTVDRLLGIGHEVLLRAEVVGDATVFGVSAAGLVRSDALVRLTVSRTGPAGLIALGCRTPGAFQPGQGTELLGFLAKVVELTFRAWLDLPE
jgi:hypothetical protein